jgi:DNA-binding NarL/FixJ family response regulator
MPKLRKPTTIGLCDDHALFRKALLGLLSVHNNEFLVTVEASNGIELIDSLSKFDEDELPKIVLLDIKMPEMDGYQTTKVLAEKFPSVKIIILSMFNDEETILKMFKLGVVAYLTKDVEPDSLLVSLRSVRDKGFFHSEDITNKLIKGIQKPKTYSLELLTINMARDTLSKLGPEERQFLSLSCTDMTYGEIATQLNLLPKQIEAMRSNLFSKFDVKTRVGLAVLITKTLVKAQDNESN